MPTLTVSAVVESLEPVTALVQRLAADAGLSPEAAYQLRLATEELFVNIVRHGYGPGRPNGRIVVEGGMSAERAWVRLIDTAPPFDPFQAGTPTGLNRPLQDRKPGELGLYLIRHAVDAASHEYVGGANRTTVVMWRARPDEDGRIGHGRDDTDRQ
ncbi:ATP-binding protein [Micromonospora sp. NPDC006766]|uniref:ATP-binding protein n=1 Tax=Micromonospora sp. NPDC006766 TaxID=3154778 RepID=UPI0033E512CD